MRFWPQDIQTNMKLNLMANGNETHLFTDMMRMMWQLATGNRFAIVCIVIAKNKMIMINIKSRELRTESLKPKLFPSMCARARSHTIRILILAIGKRSKQMNERTRKPTVLLYT